jgi:hypothetical protein
MPTFCGVDNTSKHSIQFAADQMLNVRCSAIKCEQKKILSSHHAPDWGKIVLDFFSFVLKLCLGSGWG